MWLVAMVLDYHGPIGCSVIYVPNDRALLELCVSNANECSSESPCTKLYIALGQRSLSLYSLGSFTRCCLLSLATQRSLPPAALHVQGKTLE